MAGALQQLEAMSLVDDAAYASWHVAQREASRPRSRMQLRGELFAKGVTGATAEASVGVVDDSVAVRAVAARRPRATPELLRGFLARKGFGGATVAQAVQERRRQQAAAAEEAER